MYQAKRNYIALNCTDLSDLNWVEPSSVWGRRKNKIDIWVGDLSKADEDGIVLLKHKLPFDKVAKSNRFKFDEDRNRYLLSQGMLQKIILQYTGEERVRLGFTRYGKPYLLDYPELTFNMSHSGKHVVIAFRFDGEPIGIDVEQVKDDFDFQLVAGAYCHREERNAILAAKDRGLFYKLWTRKEALLKAMEIGLTEEIRHINTLDKQFFFEGKGVLENFNNNRYDICSFELGSKYFVSLATPEHSFSYSFVNF